MLTGVDTAYAHDTYPDVDLVLGYAGGHTAHTWTVDEVTHVRELGKKWLAIWTGVNLAPLTLSAALGAQDAAGMAAKLPAYSYAKTDPVFYDVEPGVYDRDPDGARAAIAAWKAGMHAAGYSKAYVYTVERQGGDWIANWTNKIPDAIPAGKIGVQYGGDQGGFDFNVFDDSLLGDDVTPEQQAAIIKAVNDHTDTQLEDYLWPALTKGDNSVYKGGTSLPDLSAQLIQIRSVLGQSGSVDAAALVDAIQKMGAGVAKQVLDGLAARLAS